MGNLTNNSTIKISNLTVDKLTINAPYANVVLNNVVVTGGKSKLQNVCESLTVSGASIAALESTASHTITITGSAVSTMSSIIVNSDKELKLGGKIKVINLSVLKKNATLDLRGVEAAGGLPISGSALQINLLSSATPVNVAITGGALSNGNSVSGVAITSINKNTGLPEVDTSNKVAFVSGDPYNDKDSKQIGFIIKRKE